MNEGMIWMPVDGYSGFYEVSDHGVVRSLNRIIDLKNGTKRMVLGKILSAKRNNCQYFYVVLSKDGAANNYYIHRLVAFAFIQNPDTLPEVNHKDGNKANNTVDNLGWVTHAENTQHAYDTGLTSNQGSTHHFAAGVIDNYLQQEFGTIKEWCEARCINYNTGRNLISGCNKSKIINLSDIILTRKYK